MKHLIIALTLTILFAGCTKVAFWLDEATMNECMGDSLDLDYMHFLSERQATIYPTVPKKVLAFYYPWYGTPEYSGHWRHWQGVDTVAGIIENTARYPAIGPYDNIRDTTIIAHHMQLLAEAGVDGIVCSWWGIDTHEDKALDLILEQAEEHGLYVAVALNRLGRGGDFPAPEDRIDVVSQDLSYIVENYGAHPAFLKVEGGPVIFVYGAVMNKVYSVEWMSIIQNVESSVSDFRLLSDGVNILNTTTFDGAYNYNVALRVKNAGVNVPGVMETYYEQLVQQIKVSNKITTSTIIPGYDDTKNRTPGLFVDRNNGGLYQTLWESAIDANPDWVLITTFNEWHEGSEIEPSLEFGDQYIQLTEQYITAFKATPPQSGVPQPYETNLIIFNAATNNPYDDVQEEVAGLSGNFTHSALVSSETVEDAFGNAGGIEKYSVIFKNGGTADNGNLVLGDGSETVDYIEWETAKSIELNGYQMEVNPDRGLNKGNRAVELIRFLVNGNEVDLFDNNGESGTVNRIFDNGPVAGDTFRIELTRTHDAGTSSSSGPRLVEINALGVSALGSCP